MGNCNVYAVYWWPWSSDGMDETVRPPTRFKAPSAVSSIIQSARATSDQREDVIVTLVNSLHFQVI